jgi:hypothetical protein
MLTVLRNPHTPHVVTMLPSRVSFNTSWFIGENLVSLLETFFLAWWSARRRKLLLDIDNAPVHNSRIAQNSFGRNPLKRLLYPPYSPEISPSNFYLSGKIKSALI